jgi:hypothetical protein
MYRLQQAMKDGNKDEILVFFEQYFTDEEEMEILNHKKAVEKGNRYSTK